MTDFTINDNSEHTLYIDYSSESEWNVLFPAMADGLNHYRDILIVGPNNICSQYLVDMLYHMKLNYGLTSEIFLAGCESPLSYIDRYPKLGYEKFNFRDADSINALIAHVRPDLIFNCLDVSGYYHDDKEAEDATIKYSSSLFRAARDIGSKKIFNLSSGMFYAESDVPATEKQEKQPSNLYERCKILVEQEAYKYHSNKAKRIDIWSIRPAPIYGAFHYDESDIIGFLIKKGILIGPPEEEILTSVVSVKDVAFSFIRLAVSDLNHPVHDYDDCAFNIAEKCTKLKDILDRYASKIEYDSILGVKTSLSQVLDFRYSSDKRIPASLFRIFSWTGHQITKIYNWCTFNNSDLKYIMDTFMHFVQSRALSSEKIHNATGYHPFSRVNAIEKTVEFYNSCGWEGFVNDFPSSSRFVHLKHLKDTERMAEDIVDFSSGKNLDGVVRIPDTKICVDIRTAYIMISKIRDWLAMYGAKHNVHLFGVSKLGLLGKYVGDVVRYKLTEILNEESIKGKVISIIDDIVNNNFNLANKYINMILILAMSDIIKNSEKVIEFIRDITPVKSYGILMETSIGDIGVSIRPLDGGHFTIQDERKHLDNLTGGLQDRVIGMKDKTKCDLVIGFSANRIFDDLVSDNSFMSIGANIHTGYVFSHQTNLNSFYESILRDQNNYIVMSDEHDRIKYVIKKTDEEIKLCDDNEILYFFNSKQKYGKDSYTEAVREESAGMIKAGEIKLSFLKGVIRASMFPSLASKLYKKFLG